MTLRDATFDLTVRDRVADIIDQLARSESRRLIGEALRLGTYVGPIQWDEEHVWRRPTATPSGHYQSADDARADFDRMMSRRFAR